MNKRIFLPSALCGLAVIMGGCVTDKSTHTITNIEINEKNSISTSASAATQGSKFDIEAVIQNMEDNNFECGLSSDAGIWVVTKVQFQAEDNIPAKELQTRAALIARQEITEWLGTQTSKPDCVRGFGTRIYRYGL